MSTAGGFVRHWRGAIGAALAAALVIGVVGTVTPRPAALPAIPGTLPSIGEAPGFALLPEGNDVPRLAPVVVTFPGVPAVRDGAKLLTVEPALKGTFAWLSSRTLLFQPDFPGMLRGASYTVTVPAGVDSGLPQAVRQKFTVTGLLTVQQVIPSDGDTEVPLNAQVLVQFSRSVAALTTLSAQRTDRILSFDPPLEGKGEWLNTSIYRFVPASLAPSTTYRLRINKGLTSAADGVLQDDFTAAFSTVTPGVATIVPEDNFLFASPRQAVTVTFNQPMDLSAASGISVRDLAGNAVPGTVSWDATRTIATFNPLAALARSTVYIVSVEKGLKGALRGVTSALRTSSFRTISPLQILQVFPGDGEKSAGRFGIRLQFNNPMDKESLEGKLRISGFTAADLENKVFTDPGRFLSGQFASAGGVFANVALKPSTTYTVELLPGAQDVYGQVSQGYKWTFTTGALPPQVTLALSGFSQSATFSASAEPRVYFRATNVPQATFTLWPLTNDEARLMLHGGAFGIPGQFKPSQQPLRAWTETVPNVKDDVLLSSTSLSGGGPLARGYYFLRTDGQFFSQLAFAVVDTDIVTKLSTDELLVWAVDHDTGKPVAGVPVRSSGSFQTSADAVTRDATTDANGMASFTVAVPRIGDNYDRSFFVTITDGGRFAAGSTRWSPGISPFQFNLPSEFFAREWVGQIYADRPIYRPSETVSFKGIVRSDDDARYSVPRQNAPFQLVVMNARGQQVRTDDLTLSEFGTFGATFEIPADAPLGDYQLRIRVDPKVPKGGYDVAFNSFRVAEFRAPEYQVEVTTARPSYVDGSRIDVSTTASFFFGGALANAPVQWTALGSPYAMRVPGYERYSFTDLDQFRTAVQRSAVRASGKTVTDSSGVATFSVPAALAAGEGAQQFTISATVTDQNGQAVASSTTATVHPGAVYAGVRPGQYVATEGAPASIDLVSVDTSGSVLGGRKLAVKVYDREWITTKEELPGGGRKYTSTPKDTLLDTLSATTDAKGAARVAFTPKKAGVVRIVAEATDDAGHVARAATYLWVAGKEYASWQVTNDDALQLVADKDQYDVGDTAEVLVPAPFAGATGLVTVERGKIMSRDVRSFPTNSERLRIPITDRSVPDVFVSVVLYRGPTADDPTPRFKVGYVKLPVSTASRALSVKITPDRERTKPGETVRYDIKVTDRSGKPVRAELSVAVVDKAVLSLEEERGPDGLRAFWFERGLGVTTASSVSVSMDRTNDVLAEAPKVGKGGSGGGLQNDATRKDFRNTAFWSAQVKTSDDGAASVSVTMPDNLTTWRLQARAVSGDTLVGEGRSELVSTQPLLVRPALPRFFRVGDTLELRAFVRNATPKDVAAEVTLGVEGGVSVRDNAPRRVTIHPDESALVAWPATVTAEGTVKVTIVASGAGLSDPVVQSLPALLDFTPETTATGGIVTDAPMQEALYLPPFARTDRGSVSIDVRSSLVGALDGELKELGPFPWPEGPSDAASRLIATVGVRRAEKSARGSSTVYDGRIASDLASLIGRQRPDGGWAWCEPLCATDPYLTAWVLLAIGEAKKDGMAVDATAMGRAAAFINVYLAGNNAALPVKGDPRLPSVTAFRAIDPSDKAYLLAGMSSVGVLSPSVPRALFEQERARLASWGRAYLLLALTDSGAPNDDPAVRALVNDLSAAAIPTANGDHWEDEARGRFMTNTATTAVAALALARVDPEHALLPQSVRWLVYARGANKWETGIARATAILSLTRYATGTGELAGEYGWTVHLGADKILSGLAKKGETSAGSATLPLAKLTPGQVSVLEMAKDASGGRLYYKLDLRYTTPAREVEAVNRGFAVSHEYTTLDDPDKPITSIKLGETVRVKVTVMVPAERMYVTVEDLLPAGLEPVDARLRTVDPALKAKLDADRLGATQKNANTGYFAPWLRWYYSPWQRTELRDDRAVLFADRLSKGVYEYVYFARATTVGDFFLAPAHAEESFFPDVFGRSDSGRFIVAR